MATTNTSDQSIDPLAGFDVEVDTSELPDDIAELVAEVDDPDDGFFGPGSVMWKVNRENTLFLAGVSAVLLQIAHPMVSAAGVEHSDYNEDPQERFERTFDIVDTITFGDVESAVEASLIVRRLHDQVVGGLPGDVGRFDAGDMYYANDPELLLWVHATLIDQALEGYETYIGDLSDNDREQYYQESKIFGQLMGIPREEYPDTLEDFYDYYDQVIDADIAIGGPGEEVVESYFSGMESFAPIAKLLGAGTLPEGVRREFNRFGVKWTPLRRIAFKGFARLVRAVPLSLLPEHVRYREKYRHFN